MSPFVCAIESKDFDGVKFFFDNNIPAVDYLTYELIKDKVEVYSKPGCRNKKKAAQKAGSPKKD